MKLFLKQLWRAFLLVLVAAALAGGLNLGRSDALPWVQDWEETLARRAEENKPRELGLVSVEEMADIYQQEDIVVLDARPEDFYLFEHIPGAKSLPVEEAEGRLPLFMDRLDPRTRVVVYCDSASCRMAHDLAELILERGHDRVSVFVGGMNVWMERGLPVEGG